jgi:hypothetical protein
VRYLFGFGAPEKVWCSPYLYKRKPAHSDHFRIEAYRRGRGYSLNICLYEGIAESHRIPLAFKTEVSRNSTGWVFRYTTQTQTNFSSRRIQRGKAGIRRTSVPFSSAPSPSSSAATSRFLYARLHPHALGHGVHPHKRGDAVPPPYTR